MLPCRRARPEARPSTRKAGALGLAALFWLSACPLLFSGCAAEGHQADSALDYTENARRAYEEGMRALENENWEVVDELFNQVRKDYAYSRYARLAELRMADAKYEQENLSEAISLYKSFVHDYPNDAEVPYARYRIAKGQYESVSQTVMLPPLEERDLATVNDALDTIRSYLHDFPSSKHHEELKYMLEVVLGLLARHELYVARYYLAENRFEAAAARVDHALTKFPTSGLTAEGLLLLGEIRLKEKKPDQARALFQKLVDEHPESAFVVPAHHYLARMGEPSPAVLRQPVTEPSPKAAAPE